jgi:hypothetical protein
MYSHANHMFIDVDNIVYFGTEGEGPRTPCPTGAGIPSTVIGIKKTCILTVEATYDGWLAAWILRPNLTIK